MSKHSFLIWQELRQLLTIALPMIAAQLLQMAMGTIDTLMAGRIDALALSAIALGASIWHFCMLCGIGLLLALPPILSQHLGAGKNSLIREELRQGLWYALLIGIFLLGLVFLVAIIMPALGIEERIIPEVHNYLFWVAWSLPFSCLYIVPRSFHEATGFTMPTLWIQLGLLPLNAFGNYLLMFGNWGFPEMGASGAALATGISQMLGCIIVFTYTLTTKRYASFDLAKRMTPPDWAHIAQTFRLGWPIGVSIAMEAGMFMTIALLVGRFGVEAAAGHQIAISVASLTFMVPLGISMALTVRVGHAVGAKQYWHAQKRGQMGISLCTAIMMISAFFMWQMGELIASWYTLDTTVAQIAAQLLALAAIFQLADGLQVSALGTLRGYKDTKIPMLITMVCYWPIGVASASYLGVMSGYGPEGLWIGLVSGLLAAAIILNGRFYGLSHQLIKTNEANID